MNLPSLREPSIVDLRKSYRLCPGGSAGAQVPSHAAPSQTGSQHPPQAAEPLTGLTLLQPCSLLDHVENLPVASQDLTNRAHKAGTFFVQGDYLLRPEF